MAPMTNEEHREEHIPEDAGELPPDADDADDYPEDEEASGWIDEIHDDDDAPDFNIVTCPDCGHPNLEFRTRCRKCRGPMLSPSNITLGAHLMERGATDGPASHDSPHAPVRVLSVLVFVLFMLSLPILIISFELSNMAVLLIIVMAVALLYWVQEQAAQRAAARVRDAEQRDMPLDPNSAEAEELDEEEIDRAPTRSCASCDNPLMDYDDICPACGEIAAFD